MTEQILRSIGWSLVLFLLIVPYSCVFGKYPSCLLDFHKYGTLKKSLPLMFEMGELFQCIVPTRVKESEQIQTRLA